MLRRFYGFRRVKFAQSPPKTYIPHFSEPKKHRRISQKNPLFGRSNSLKPNTLKLRIGQGYDVHELKEGAPLILGGVAIPHTHGLKSHSDGDALTHALCDALLGALGLRDIGYHFSDTDAANRGRNSQEFLKAVMEMVRDKGYEISNLDATVVLEAPKVNPHVPAMIRKLCETMAIREEDLSVKATTSEKMGFVGRREGISVFAVALVYKVTDNNIGL